MGTIHFQAGSLERRVYDHIRGKYHHLLSETLIKSIVSDILSEKYVHVSEGEKIEDLNKKLQEAEDNEDDLVEMLRTFRDELKLTLKGTDDLVEQIAERFRMIDSMAVCMQRKISEFEPTITQIEKERHNGQSVLQEA